MTPVFISVIVASLDMMPVLFICFAKCFATGLIKELSIRLRKIGSKIEKVKNIKKIEQKVLELQEIYY